MDLWSGKAVNLSNNTTPNPYSGKVVTNSEGAKVTIDIPSDYVSRVTDNGNGIIYQASGSQGNSNIIRIMGPTEYAPNGYVVFHNKYGQPFNPITGKTLSKSLWHFNF